MSRTTALGVMPDRRPVMLREFPNSWGWSPSIWPRLCQHHGLNPSVFDEAALNQLWAEIENLPEWQQAPLVLTFDTGVIPAEAFDWAADQFDEFEARLPEQPSHANHVPTMAELLRSKPEVPLLGVWGTSVTENPFDPWDEEADEPGSGIGLDGMYVLERHRALVRAAFEG